MAHNNRKFITENVDKNRIRDNITYKAEPIEESYQKLFWEEVKRYNIGKKPCRQIPNYMEHIRQSKNGEKLFYETVVQVGNKFDCPAGSNNAKISEQILDKYMKSFQERNPNLYVFNAVLHLDEATPHLHIDYIPVAHGYQKGLQVRNSLDKALKEQGIDGKANKKENSTHNWQENEKSTLENIMKDYGLERTPDKGLHRKHMTVDQYKAIVEQVQQEVEQIPAMIESTPMLLNNKKVSVNREDLEKLEQRAKFSSIHEDSVKHLVNDVQETLDLTQQGYKKIKGKELTLEAEIRQIRQYKEVLQAKMEEQMNLNKNYKLLSEKYNGLEQQHKELFQENQILKTTIQKFKEKMQDMAKTTKNIVCSISWLDNKFKDSGLDKFCNAVKGYAKEWLTYDGFPELAVTLDEPVLTDGIKNRFHPDYKEIVYYKGEKGRGWYASKAEGGSYLGDLKNTEDILHKFPNAKFKDPHELINLSLSALNKGIIKGVERGLER